MQSIDYTIKSFSPIGKNSIDNIIGTNPSTYWSSLRGISTIEISFEFTLVKEITISTNTNCNYVITLSGTIIEGKISHKQGQIYMKKIPLNLKELISEMKFDITTEKTEELKLFYIVIKNERDTDTVKIKSTNQTSLESYGFYPSGQATTKSNGTPIKKQIENTPKSYTGSGGKKNGQMCRRIEVENIDQQKQIYEEIKETNLKTLKGYTPEKLHPTNSYKNLYLNESGQYIVYCNDEEQIQTIVAEICGIIGICYLDQLENEVTHVVYSGFDQNFLYTCKHMGITVVDKLWIFDSIEKRQALDPSVYIRNV